MWRFSILLLWQLCWGSLFAAWQMQVYLITACFPCMNVLVSSSPCISEFLTLPQVLPPLSQLLCECRLRIAQLGREHSLPLCQLALFRNVASAYFLLWVILDSVHLYGKFASLFSFWHVVPKVKKVFPDCLMSCTKWPWAFKLAFKLAFFSYHPAHILLWIIIKLGINF